MRIETLLNFNRQGIIPGPGESHEAFTERAHYCLTLKEHLSQELKAPLGEEANQPAILAPALDQLARKYDISPQWIPLFFSDYRLSLWHGGCAWIFQMTESAPVSALIQLKNRLRHASSYLCYQRDELLAHELVHVGRMMFHEPCFEELLAYRTSSSRWRRYFGPLIQSSIESVIFILLLFIIIVFDVFLMMTHHPTAYQAAFWLKMIPLGCIAYALVRLMKRHKTFNACLENLEACLGSREKAEAVIFRLQDYEIEKLAKMAPNDIRTYANSQQELRWQVIAAAYFNQG